MPFFAYQIFIYQYLVDHFSKSKLIFHWLVVMGWLLYCTVSLHSVTIRSSHINTLYTTFLKAKSYFFDGHDVGCYIAAFIGALYVDKDVEVCYKFCEVCFFPRLKVSSSHLLLSNMQFLQVFKENVQEQSCTRSVQEVLIEWYSCTYTCMITSINNLHYL